MGVVSNTTKVTGNKKPLSSLTTEVVKPKGAVLLIILNSLFRLSNLLCAQQELALASTACKGLGV